MKRNELVQVKGLDVKQLKNRVKILKVDIGKLIMDKNMKKLKDLKQISKKKKDLAQVLTVLRQKEILSGIEAKIKAEQNAEELEKQKGGKQVEVVMDDLADNAKLKSRTRTKSVQSKK